MFRVTSRAQQEQARQSFRGETTEDLDRQMKRPIPLLLEFTAVTGDPAQLRIREAAADCHHDTVAAGEEWPVCVRSPEPAQQAVSRPADPGRIRDQLAKLGGTPFTAAPEDIEVMLDGRCAVPVSQINRMRREGIRQLLQEKRRVRRAPADVEELRKAEEELAEDHLRIPQPPAVSVRLGRPVPLMDFMAGEAGMPCLPEITKGNADAWISQHFEEITQAVKESGIIVNNTGWIRPFQKAGVKVYGGHGLNVYNEQARRAFEECGVEIIEASFEADAALDGPIPLMITEHPVQSKTLTDRKGQVHRVERTRFGDKTVIW